MNLASEEPPPWYRLTHGEEWIVISLQPADLAWAPEVLVRAPLPSEGWLGKRVLLEGKGPLWMYAHAVAVAVAAGAQQVAVSQPQAESPVTVFPVQPVRGASAGLPWVTTSAKGTTVVRFQRPEPGSRWDPCLLPLLAHAAASWGVGAVVFTGPAANWMLGAAVAAAPAHLPLWYAGPREPSLIPLNGVARRGTPPPDEEMLAEFGGPRGTILGIIGDPNSGKSIFSRLLVSGFETRGLLPVWRMDCDHAAETSDWYLEMRAQGRQQPADRLRSGYKRPWTAAAERQLANNLVACSRQLRWVIADLPGGIHTATQCERIPEGRQVLFDPIDHFVLVRRHDRPQAEQGWKQALAEHGFGMQLCAVVQSDAPQRPLEIEFVASDMPRVRITGMDREGLHGAGLPKVTAGFGELASRIARAIGEAVAG